MGKKAVSYLLSTLGVVFTLLLLAAAILSWRASSLSPLMPEWSNFWMAIALFMPVILLLNAVAMVWWLIRGKWGVMLAPVIAIVLNLNYISAMVQLPDFTKHGGERDIRVMSLNVLGFRQLGSVPVSAHAITYIASREQVDLLCLQEFVVEHTFNVDSIAALVESRMPYVVHGASLAICSRYPILDHRSVSFPDSGNGYIWADLDIEGKRVRVFSVHLQTSGLASLLHRLRKNPNHDAPIERLVGSLEQNTRIRAKQVDEIRQIIDETPGPVIVAGDFNETPSSYVYRRMKGDMIDGFRASGRGFGGTFRSFGGFLRLDYIFYNDAFTSVRYCMLDEQISDHKAVVADLCFKQ